MTLKYEKNKKHILKYAASHPDVLKRATQRYIESHPDFKDKRREYMKEYRARKKLEKQQLLTINPV